MNDTYTAGPFACRGWRWSGGAKAPKNKSRTEVWYYESETGSRDVHLDVFDGEKYIGHISFTMPVRKRKA